MEVEYRDRDGRFTRKGKEYVVDETEHSAQKLQTQQNAPRPKYTKEERDFEGDAKTLRRANANVTKPIIRLSKPGRAKKYTPTKMRNKINDYFCDCEKKDRVPSLKGMMLYLKLTPNSAYTYKKYPEFESIFEQAMLIISEWLESDVYQSKGQAAGKLAYMQNLHNWSNKTEVETTQRELTVEEAKAKIGMLAPALLEMIKSSPELLKQLVPSTVVEAVVVENE